MSDPKVVTVQEMLLKRDPERYKDILKVREKNEKKAKSNQELGKEVKLLEAENEGLLSKLETERSKVEALTAELDEANQKLQEVDEGDKLATEKIEELEATIADLRKQLEEKPKKEK